MRNQQSINVSIPQDFISIYEEFNSIIEKDSDFKKILKDKLEKDKRIEKAERRNGFKVRYAISFCLKELKKKQIQLKMEKERNEKTKSGSV